MLSALHEKICNALARLSAGDRMMFTMVRIQQIESIGKCTLNGRVISYANTN